MVETELSNVAEAVLRILGEDNTTVGGISKHFIRNDSADKEYW